MEPRMVRKKTIYELVLGGLGTVLILVLGFLWYQNVGIIKDVQAQCIRLDDKKVDVVIWKSIDDRLKRIEDKLDDL
jgi:hypothetical protein